MCLSVCVCVCVCVFLYLKKKISVSITSEINEVGGLLSTILEVMYCELLGVCGYSHLSDIFLFKNIAAGRFCWRRSDVCDGYPHGTA